MSEQKALDLIGKLHKAQKEKNIELEIKYLIELGIYHYENKEFLKSKLSFENVLKLNKQIPEVNYYLALNSLSEDKLDDAKKHLEKELEINPSNIDAKNILEKLKINANIPLVTIFLILINFIVFYFTYPNISLLHTIKYTLSYDTISITNAITSLFFHANLIHFSVNMIILVSFGIILEKHIGSLKFLLIYLVSGIVGNIIQSIAYHNYFVLGASAALFGILGAIVIINPLLELKILGLIKAPIILVFGGFFAINTLIQNYLMQLNFNLVSGDIAHLIGFLSGILIISLFYHEKLNVFYNWLLIFIGFSLIIYSLENLIMYFSSINIIFIILQLIIIVTGIYMIIISYTILKTKLLKKEGN